MNIPNVESPAHVSLQVFKNNCGYAVTEHRYREEGYDSMPQFSFMSALFSWGVSQCSWKWRFWFLLSTSHILPQNQYYLLNDAKICPVCYLTSLNIVLIFFTFQATYPQKLHSQISPDPPAAPLCLSFRRINLPHAETKMIIKIIPNNANGQIWLMIPDTFLHTFDT